MEVLSKIKQQTRFSTKKYQIVFMTSSVTAMTSSVKVIMMSQVVKVIPGQQLNCGVLHHNVKMYETSMMT